LLAREGAEAMEQVHKNYLSAAGRNWLLPLYDPLVKLVGGDAARRALLEQVPIRPGERVLDIGCGTGTLVVLIKQLHPDAEVIGLDPDPNALARGKRKAERSSVSVRFDQGFADALPYADAAMDRVLSSFMFHHLESGEKENALREVRRVLKPAGVFTLLDFDGPNSRENGFLARLIHSSHHLKDNSEDRILALVSQAGFLDPKKIKDGTMLFGCVRTKYYQAYAPH
jgi:ubiquinone/menaquinone biosynthesis C-methylase UbiE